MNAQTVQLVPEQIFIVIIYRSHFNVGRFNKQFKIAEP